ncbi:MAG: hypothetical protein K2O59_15035 [Lachnospiraceae bacterium]|nr:hypothetical protein [Lachnospiraceae bacterium]
MRQCEVLMAKKLFDGSDIIRRYTYKAGTARDNYALFWETDCFVCSSPFDGIDGRMAVL